MCPSLRPPDSVRDNPTTICHRPHLVTVPEKPSSGVKVWSRKLPGVRPMSLTYMGFGWLTGDDPVRRTKQRNAGLLNANPAHFATLDLRSFDRRHVITLRLVQGVISFSIRRFLHATIPTTLFTGCGYRCVCPKLMVWLTRKAETMTPQEASQLVELASTIWATVKNTPGTCEAWSLALAQTNFYDAKDAIGSLARERKTIHVSDVVKRAASMREALLRSLPPIPDPPVELADNLQAEVQWIRTARERQLHQARLERHAVAV